MRQPALLLASVWLIHCGTGNADPAMSDPDASAAGGGQGEAPDAGAGFDAGAQPDAGTPANAGTPSTDAGLLGLDAGTPGFDAGTPPVDAGAAPTDGGAIPGLGSHWAFDEGPGITFNNNGDAYIYDELSHSDTGRIKMGVTTVQWTSGAPLAGPNPYAMRVVSGYVYLVQNSVDLPRLCDRATLGLWLNLPASLLSSAEQRSLMEHASTGVMATSVDLTLNVYAGNGGVHVTLDEQQGGLSADLRAAVSTPGWHHLAWLYDGAEFRLYLDGVKAAQHAGTLARTDYTKYLPSQFTASDAAMDDLRFYNRALTDAEILAVAQGHL